jgi:hypothetical protein
MKQLKLIPIILLISLSLSSQETDTNLILSRNLYKVKIRHTDGTSTRGYAYLLSEDKVSVFTPENSSSHSNIKMSGMQGVVSVYPTSEISKISFRQKNHLRNNIIGGLVVGTLTGLLVAHIKENGIAIEVNDNITLDFTHPPVPVKYPRIVLRGAAIGTLVGAISGSISKTFILKGKKERFIENKENMNHFMYAQKAVPAF